MTSLKKVKAIAVVLLASTCAICSAAPSAYATEAPYAGFLEIGEHSEYEGQAVSSYDSFGRSYGVYDGVPLKSAPLSIYDGPGGGLTNPYHFGWHSKSSSDLADYELYVMWLENNDIVITVENWNSHFTANNTAEGTGILRIGGFCTNSQSDIYLNGVQMNGETAKYTTTYNKSGSSYSSYEHDAEAAWWETSFDVESKLTKYRYAFGDVFAEIRIKNWDGQPFVIDGILYGEGISSVSSGYQQDGLPVIASLSTEARYAYAQELFHGTADDKDTFYWHKTDHYGISVAEYNALDKAEQKLYTKSDLRELYYWTTPQYTQAADEIEQGKTPADWVKPAIVAANLVNISNYADPEALLQEYESKGYAYDQFRTDVSVYSDGSVLVRCETNYDWTPPGKTVSFGKVGFLHPSGNTFVTGDFRAEEFMTDRSGFDCCITNEAQTASLPYTSKSKADTITRDIILTIDDKTEIIPKGTMLFSYRFYPENTYTSGTIFFLSGYELALNDTGITLKSSSLQDLTWGGVYDTVFTPMTVPVTTVSGDIDADGELTVSDIIRMQKWLLASHDWKMACWETGDMNKDGVIDVFDLALMKRALLEQRKVENEEFLAGLQS